MRSNVQYTVQSNIREGQLENARALANEMSTAIHSEPGSVQYEWFFSADGSTCHILEEYADSDAAVAHLHNFLTNFVERFMGCFEPTAIFVYGDPSDEFRKTMEPFGAKYLGGVAGFIK